MLSTFANFLTTIFLTLICALTLFFMYRWAVKPIIGRYNFPLRDLSSFGSRRGYSRVATDEDRAREVEEGFRDESSDEEEGEDGRGRL